MTGDKPDRLEKLVEEMERQLQRPLTAEERRCLSLYLEAIRENGHSEAAGNSSR